VRAHTIIDDRSDDEELRNLRQRSEDFTVLATSPPMSPQFMRRNQSASMAAVSITASSTSRAIRSAGGGKRKGHSEERRGSLEPRNSVDDGASSPRGHVAGPPIPQRLEHSVSAGGESQWLLESLKALGLEGESSASDGSGGTKSDAGGRMTGVPVMSSMPSLATAVRQPPPIPDRCLTRNSTYPRPSEQS
jgi:hypothetical protein